MSAKSRGISGERDLIHKFWAEGWASLRVAGSGSSQYPSPDVLASNNVRKLAIEAKITTATSKNFPKEEIESLRFFAEKFGAEPWIAIRFYREPWKFYTLEDLHATPGGFSVRQEDKDKGLSFEELIA